MSARDGRRASVVGTGLIGGSIGLALRAQGWHVTGVDRDEQRLQDALEVGAVDAVGLDPDAEVTFVAVPVGAVPEAVAEALASTAGVVTDVGSVKSPMIELMAAEARYVGGHPMAGSEQEGVRGARPDLFDGATWVLTPIPGTDDVAFAAVQQVVAGLGAHVVAIPPDQHDRLVAEVSHVPHLTAVTLMDLAAERARDDQVLLRLAGGGFRDMTRIASGDPGIWPDICEENRDAIVAELGRLIGGLEAMRAVIADGDRHELARRLAVARRARANIPDRYRRPEDLTQVRVPIPDEAGAAAQVFVLASELDVSVANFEVVHSTESSGGVLVLLVESSVAARLRGALEDRGLHPTLHPLV